jgi:hypothetical protein
MNHEMRQVLAAGGRVEVDVVVEATNIGPSGERLRIKLDWKPERVLVEAAVLLASRQAELQLLNL